MATMQELVNAAIAAQDAGNKSVSVTGTEGELLQTRQSKTPRMMLSITPVTAGVTLFISLGEQTAALNTGQPLTANQPFTQSANSLTEALQSVWQGSIRQIATGAGTVAIVEEFWNGNVNVI